MEDYCTILSATGSMEEAKNIANILVKAKFAACVQITDITSVYEWKNKINCDEEKLLIIKTKTSLYNDVQRAILENHSYEVPEIIMIPVKNGLSKYLSWIDGVCS